jgi:hypothetical protein
VAAVVWRVPECHCHFFHRWACAGRSFDTAGVFWAPLEPPSPALLNDTNCNVWLCQLWQRPAAESTLLPLCQSATVGCVCSAYRILLNTVTDALYLAPFEPSCSPASIGVPATHPLPLHVPLPLYFHPLCQITPEKKLKILYLTCHTRILLNTATDTLYLVPFEPH